MQLFSPGFYEDPYPAYKTLRGQDPVHYDERVGWLITRYADVRGLSQTSLLSREIYEDVCLEGLATDVCELTQPFFNSTRQQMLRKDPPAHTKARQAANVAFRRIDFNRIEKRTEELADLAIDAIPNKGDVDLIGDFALPISSVITMELIGIPPEDQKMFTEWTAVRMQCRTGLRTIPNLRELAIQTNAITRDWAGYFRDLVKDKKRDSSGDDLLCKLLNAGQDQTQIPYNEVVPNVTLMISSGNEIMTHVIGNGLLALLRHPEELRELRDNPGLISSGINEILRYDTPDQLIPRAARIDFELHGRQIRARDRVTLALGSANRDGDQFDNPDKFILARWPNNHLAFGFDHHICIAARLVRAVASVAITNLLKRANRIALSKGQLRWRPTAASRGLSELRVELSVGA